MENYCIGESYTLPSLGKIYNTPVNPEIKLRSMTELILYMLLIRKQKKM